MWEKIEQSFLAHVHYTPKNKVSFFHNFAKGIEDSRTAVANHFDIDPSTMSFNMTGRNGYLLDCTWSTYPAGRKFTFANRSDWPSQKYQLLLAAESEAGGNDKYSLAKMYEMVLEDFVKLLDVNAPIKLIGYRVPSRSIENDGFEDIQNAFEAILNLHRTDRANELWLFIGIPWYEKKWAVPSLDARVHIIFRDAIGRLVLKVPEWIAQQTN